jgi:hypothetical protein
MQWVSGRGAPLSQVGRGPSDQLSLTRTHAVAARPGFFGFTQMGEINATVELMV